jgi:hypothetical protein
MVLCALANTFQNCKKKATNLGEVRLYHIMKEHSPHLFMYVSNLSLLPMFQLNKSYIEICRSTQVPAVGMLEFSSMCMVLSDHVCKYRGFCYFKNTFKEKDLVFDGVCIIGIHEARAIEGR